MCIIGRPVRSVAQPSSATFHGQEGTLSKSYSKSLSDLKLSKKKAVIEFKVANSMVGRELKKGQTTVVAHASVATATESSSKQVKPKAGHSKQSNQGEVVEEVERSWKSLADSLQGAKLDSLILLIVTSAVIPIFKTLKTSPILGFLMTGTLLGPFGLRWVKDIHMIDTLGELGIVFFLFEMGLELSFDRLMAMRKDVFGLGTSQFLVTTAAGTGIFLRFKKIPLFFLKFKLLYVVT